jgi:hypothetical protein
MLYVSLYARVIAEHIPLLVLQLIPQRISHGEDNRIPSTMILPNGIEDEDLFLQQIITIYENKTHGSHSELHFGG